MTHPTPTKNQGSSPGRNKAKNKSGKNKNQPDPQPSDPVIDKGFEDREDVAHTPTKKPQLPEDLREIQPDDIQPPADIKDNARED